VVAAVSAHCVLVAGALSHPRLEGVEEASTRHPCALVATVFAAAPANLPEVRNLREVYVPFDHTVRLPG
jgi:hypothetical protein